MPLSLGAEIGGGVVAVVVWSSVALGLVGGVTAGWEKEAAAAA